MGGLISAAVGFLLNSSVLRFLATKVLLYSLLVVVAPVVLWNLGVDWAGYLMGLVASVIPADSYAFSVAGLAGWALAALRVPEAVSVIVAGAVTRMVIRVLIR